MDDRWVWIIVGLVAIQIGVLAQVFLDRLLGRLLFPLAAGAIAAGLTAIGFAVTGDFLFSLIFASLLATGVLVVLVILAVTGWRLPISDESKPSGEPDTR